MRSLLFKNKIIPWSQFSHDEGISLGVQLILDTFPQPHTNCANLFWYCVDYNQKSEYNCWTPCWYFLIIDNGLSSIKTGYHDPRIEIQHTKIIPGTTRGLLYGQMTILPFWYRMLSINTRSLTGLAPYGPYYSCPSIDTGNAISILVHKSDCPVSILDIQYQYWRSTIDTVHPLVKL